MATEAKLHKTLAKKTRVKQIKLVMAVSSTPGILESNTVQNGLQFYGVGITIAYSRIVTVVLIKIVGAVIGLRVKEDHEREGLDIKLRGEGVA